MKNKLLDYLDEPPAWLRMTIGVIVMLTVVYVVISFLLGPINQGL